MWEAWCIFKLIANVWRNRAPHKPGHFVAESFQRVFFFSFLFKLSFTKTCLSCLQTPLCAPHPPFLPTLQRALAWALALNSDLACNQSYPWALPSSQATDSSSLLPSPLPRLFLLFSLCPQTFFFFFFLSLSLNPEWQSWLLMGCCSETTESKHSLSSWTTDPKPHCQLSPQSTALSVNLWSDLELMSKWWCQPVRTGQLSSGAPMRQANSPNLGHTPPVCSQLCHSLFPLTYVWIVGEVLLINTDRSIWKETESESIWTWRRFQRFQFE